MPARALTPCSKPGCSTLVERSGYCSAHAYLRDAYRALHEQTRESASQRGYTGRWKKYRLRYLDAHPLCCDPYSRHVGIVTPATVVDHITPHKGNHRLFWNPENHQPLCASCHGVKSSIEEGGRAASATHARFETLMVGSVDASGGIVHASRTPRKGVHTSGQAVRKVSTRVDGRGGEISGPQSAYTVRSGSAIIAQVCNSTGKNEDEVSYARR